MINDNKLHTMEETLERLDSFKKLKHGWYNPITKEGFGFVAENIDWLKAKLKQYKFENLALLTVFAIPEMQGIIFEADTKLNTWMHVEINLETRQAEYWEKLNIEGISYKKGYDLITMPVDLTRRRNWKQLKLLVDTWVANNK